MLLAIELSGPRNSVALWNGETTAEVDFSEQRGKGLMQAVQTLLANENAERQDLRGILVGIGPGSYTGLRIACSAGIMLGYALDIPCAGLPSFDAAAFAQNLENEKLHLILDAYRKEVYHATYLRRGDSLETLQMPQVISLADGKAKVDSDAFLGDVRLATRGVQLRASCQASAVDLLLFAQSLGLTPDGRGVDQLQSAEPLYLRPAVFRP
ncbi:MAG: tRNA (adenosine(37)-N6)-threonylcarbamoyltransferase complex dimerization subunit type 1 TsaB [Planctomycetota bacterium]|nr:tRNA (adenosine(37)-N6)-threonylcarbamoyltransferase complex dimerization subunit type 1 TsaB [Planctomycetota bacterium]MDA1113301.1 tRNA (adenosine(37)-N6)-threonylcarbamoyltransferase complex dimerization subunit type 1 TsaB [Planctomycetota bacterium]